MLKIAITGNIASGKSMAQEFLIQRGFKVIDTDEIAANIRKINEKNIIKLFSDYNITDKNTISPEKLGKIIFDNKDLNEKLSNFMHPLIRAEIKKFFELNKTEEMVFVAIPLLFEAHMETDYDKIIFIYADDNIRLKRLIKRNKLNINDAQKRLSSQLDQNQKLKQSDYVIINNSTKETFIKKFDELLIKLKQEQKL
jgi:dephospho-CoA kinase